MTDEHSESHSVNAFCGNAGPEELKHLETLVDNLSDDQLSYLVKEGGIDFGGEMPRDILEGVVDEIDRETFYRLYREIQEGGKKNS